MFRTVLRRSVPLLCIILSACMSYMVLRKQYSIWFPLLWVMLILVFLMKGIGKKTLRSHVSKLKEPRMYAVVLVCILLPTILRIFYYQPERLHGDDAMTGYFSAHYDLVRTNFFAPVPPNSADWVAQFPSTYFVFQNIFFKLAGMSVLTLKLSAIPYIMIIGVLTYLTARLITGRIISLLAVTAYSVFAPSVYLETLGLHFTASTAVALICFYAMIRALQTERTWWFRAAGIFCGFCYLFYTSSYIALGVCVLMMGVGLLRHFRAIVRGFPHFLVGFMLVLAPFIAYMAGTGSFYLAGRVNQVSFLTGEWSPVSKEPKSNLLSQVIPEQVQLSLIALIEDGHSGHGGYQFGKLALMDRYTVLLVVLGFLLLILNIRKYPAFLLILVPGITFISGVLLTIPPPAFHRLSLAFPYLAIISALPFAFLLDRTKNKIFRTAVGTAAVLVLFSINTPRIDAMLKGEETFELLKLSNIINQSYPRRLVYVAAFPGHAFEKIYFFSRGKNALSVLTDYHANILKPIYHNKRHVTLLIFPKDFLQPFQEAYPNDKIVYTSADYAMLVSE
jgi:hypothetical protein